MALINCFPLKRYKWSNFSIITSFQGDFNDNLTATEQVDTFYFELALGKYFITIYSSSHSPLR